MANDTCFEYSLFKVNHLPIILDLLFAALFNLCKFLSLIIITVSLANSLTLNLAILRSLNILRK